MFRALSTFAMALAVIAGPAAAQINDIQEQLPPEAAVPVAKYGEWTLFVYDFKGGKVCAMATEPRKTQAPRTVKKKRDPAVFSISHRTYSGEWGLVGINAGLVLAPGSDAHLNINGLHYALFTKGRGAWTSDFTADRTILQALLNARIVIALQTTKEGAEVKDYYHLAGFEQAKEAIDIACGLKRPVEPGPPAADPQN